MSTPAAAPAEDPHYLRDVTALGDSREVRTREAVYSKNRIKLIAQGARVDSTLFERLMQHKLATPLEQSLKVAEAVSGEDLV